MDMVMLMIEAATCYVETNQWWHGSEKKAQNLDDDSSLKIKPLRSLLKAHSEIRDDDVDELFAMRGRKIEIFGIEVGVKDFVKNVLNGCRCLADKIYTTWRNDMKALQDELASGTPDWKMTENNVLDNPLLSKLLLNPAYNSLGHNAAKMDAMLTCGVSLHSDGCGNIFDCNAMDAARSTKAYAIDTVSLTYALYHATQHLPKIVDLEDRKTKAGDIIKQIDAKNYTLPEILSTRLKMISDGTRDGLKTVP
jgi:hypothetical protein